MAYCVKCKRHTETNNLHHFIFVAKNGRVMLKGTCAVSGKTKTQFVISGGGLFNKAVSNLPFELHISGHNCTGPETKLDRRLNPDGTPRDWSKPIKYRVDKAAYHHDLCYAKNPDTRTRNEVCDREMLRDRKSVV